jgi:hypothetical protein
MMTIMMTVAKDELHESTANGRAAGSLYVVAVMDAVHVLAANLTAMPEKRTFWVVFGVLVLNAAVIGLLIWLGSSVRHGRRIAGAVALLSFMVFGAALALVTSLVRGYSGTWGLMVVQLLFVGAILCACVLVLRTWVASVR